MRCAPSLRRRASCRPCGLRSATLRGIPTLALRGAHSDVLSAATFERMQQEHGKMLAVTARPIAAILRNWMNLRRTGDRTVSRAARMNRPDGLQSRVRRRFAARNRFELRPHRGRLLNSDAVLRSVMWSLRQPVHDVGESLEFNVRSVLTCEFTPYEEPKAPLCCFTSALLVAACASEAPVSTPAPTASAGILQSGVYSQNFDRAVRPQDDFYRYVNGQWLTTTEIPADRSNYGAFTMLEDGAERDLHSDPRRGLQRRMRPPARTRRRSATSMRASWMRRPSRPAG